MLVPGIVRVTLLRLPQFRNIIGGGWVEIKFSTEATAGAKQEQQQKRQKMGVRLR